MTLITPSSPMPWQDSLHRGHIVSYQFPNVPGAGDMNESEKHRPGLVLGVGRQPDGTRHALIAYGTSIMRQRVPRRDLVVRVNDPRDAAMAGLDKPTMFQGGRWVLVPLGDPRFGSKDGSPIIGRLPSCYYRRGIDLVCDRIYRDQLRKRGVSTAALRRKAPAAA